MVFYLNKNHSLSNFLLFTVKFLINTSAEINFKLKTTKTKAISYIFAFHHTFNGRY